MRTFVLVAAALMIFSGAGCHHLGKRHKNCGNCQTCAGHGGHAEGHRGLFGHGGPFRKSDMCDACAPGGAGPYSGTDGSEFAGGPGMGPGGHDGGAYGPGGPGGMGHGGPGGLGHGGAGHYPVRGTPGFPQHHYSREYVGPQGPSTPAVAYPYYTTRGPRDFLDPNPPSIGR